jgi:hypothetical protein
MIASNATLRGLKAPNLVDASIGVARQALLLAHFNFYVGHAGRHIQFCKTYRDRTKVT